MALPNLFAQYFYNSIIKILQNFDVQIRIPILMGNRKAASETGASHSCLFKFLIMILFKIKLFRFITNEILIDPVFKDVWNFDLAIGL